MVKESFEQMVEVICYKGELPVAIVIEDKENDYSILGIIDILDVKPVIIGKPVKENGALEYLVRIHKDHSEQECVLREYVYRNTWSLAGTI